MRLTSRAQLFYLSVVRRIGKGVIMLAVETRNLTKKYKEVTALNGCDLQVEEGELFGLLGVNGAGKTTLKKRKPQASA